MLYIKNKTKKSIKIISKILLFIFIIIICSIFTPIKIALNPVNFSSNKPYFIVKQISSGSTDSGLWLCIGDENGFYTDKCYTVELYGKTPQEIISKDINETMFVIYHTAGDNMDINAINRINSCKWDFLGDIHRNSESLRIPFQKYITIYDLKFFDFLADY